MRGGRRTLVTALAVGAAAGTVALATASLVAQPAAPSPAAEARTKVILDTDIGTDIDDAWALGVCGEEPVARGAWRDRHRRRHDGAGEVGLQAAASARDGPTCRSRSGDRRRPCRPIATTTSSRGRRTSPATSPWPHRAADFIADLDQAPSRSGDARGRRPAPEPRRSAPPASRRAKARQAGRAHERIDRRQRVELSPGGGMEREAGDPRGADGLRRRMAAHDRAARLDDLRQARGP